MSSEWSKNHRAAADSARLALEDRFPGLPPAMRGFRPVSGTTMQGDM
jgi:hypothetical protein